MAKKRSKPVFPTWATVAWDTKAALGIASRVNEVLQSIVDGNEIDAAVNHNEITKTVILAENVGMGSLVFEQGIDAGKTFASFHQDDYFYVGVVDKSAPPEGANKIYITTEEQQKQAREYFIEQIAGNKADCLKVLTEFAENIKKRVEDSTCIAYELKWKFEGIVAAEYLLGLWSRLGNYIGSELTDEKLDEAKKEVIRICNKHLEWKPQSSTSQASNLVDTAQHYAELGFAKAVTKLIRLIDRKFMPYDNEFSIRLSSW